MLSNIQIAEIENRLANVKDKYNQRLYEMLTLFTYMIREFYELSKDKDKAEKECLRAGIKFSPGEAFLMYQRLTEKVKLLIPIIQEALNENAGSRTGSRTDSRST